MPHVMFELSADQIRELTTFFNVEANPMIDEPRGDVVAFIGRDATEMDAFVQRCIGTALELEAFQETGGQLLTRDRSGDVRELLIHVTRNGGTLRPPRIIPRAQKSQL